MWTDENRAGYDRGRLRYPSDLEGEEWALVKLAIRTPSEGATSARLICVRW